MATAGHKSRILIGDMSYSPRLADASLPRMVDMHEVTTYADNGVKKFIPGLDSSTFNASGFLDVDGHADTAAWSDATPITYAPFGLSRTSIVFLVNSIRGSFEVGSQVSGAVSFSVDATTDGQTFGVGRSLVDLSDRTASTDETSYDTLLGSPTGGTAQLHVTAYSGFTNCVFKMQHSTNNSTWNDYITFSTVTGTTSERVASTSTTNRYWRAQLTVSGTGSVTYQMSFATI